jgi:CheY-like chemotaxis protein
MEVLEAEGYQVCCARHGLEALELLRRESDFRLILLDLMLPVMNGAQFREAQRQDPALARVPVVVISADVAVEKKAQALEAAAWLRKPIALDALLDTVERYSQ